MNSESRLQPLTPTEERRRGAVDQILGAADKAAAAPLAIAEVRQLHRRRPLLIRGTTVETWQCGQCDAEYPCPTIKIIERHGL